MPHQWPKLQQWGVPNKIRPNTYIHTLGIKGHVCSFPQRVQDLYTTLPKFPSSATFVKMIGSFKGEKGKFF
jgi:hypothetical protein